MRESQESQRVREGERTVDRAELESTSTRLSEFDSASVNRLDVDRDGSPRLHIQPCAGSSSKCCITDLNVLGPNRVLELQKQYQVAIIAVRTNPLLTFPRPTLGQSTSVPQAQSRLSVRYHLSFVQCAHDGLTTVVYGAIFSLGMMSTVYGIGCLVTGYVRACESPFSIHSLAVFRGKLHRKMHDHIAIII
jgi:hypothetical protein